MQIGALVRSIVAFLAACSSLRIQLRIADWGRTHRAVGRCVAKAVSLFVVVTEGCRQRKEHVWKGDMGS